MGSMAPRDPQSSVDERGSDPTPSAGRPVVSIVSAVFDVARYLPDFIASIERQGAAPGVLEVVAVDDGSTDGSLEILEAWRDRAPFPVTVLHQANAGQSAARNLGLEHATGEWVTFTDPDDMLAPGFLDAILRFVGRHPDVALVASMPIVFDERTGTEHRHARHRQYAAGDRVVDLDREPSTFGGSSSVSFFRLDRIRAAGLRFDPRVRPNFEDGHFAVRYVLELAEPRIGVVPSARYLYRRRADGTSSVQRSHGDPGRYTAVFEHGYLDVIARGKARHARLPAWLQQVLVYELTWYLMEDERLTATATLADDIVPVFHAHLAAVLRELDPDVVADHRVRRLKPRWRDIFIHAGRPEPWRSPTAAVTRVDEAMRLERVTYRFTGPPPAETLSIRGQAIEPAWAKSQAHVYYGRPLIHTRILWLPAGAALTLTLDGEPVRIRPPRAVGRAHADGDEDATGAAGSVRSGTTAVTRLSGAVTRLRRAAVLRRARSGAVRERYRDAWVLADRANEADDNGERLFEHLRANRPDINAWFAISGDAPDHARLRSLYGERVVARGTEAFTQLMLNAAWLLSSHADRVVSRPDELDWLIDQPTWKFGFLQHGVIKDDLSIWLNGKQVDLFVVSTAPELESIVGDDTTYGYTGKETRLTGLPRFDRLLRKAHEVEPQDRSLVLVAPTWRSWLTSSIDPETFQREIDSGLAESRYWLEWAAILRSPRVADAAAAAGLTVAFMPHPIMQPMLDALDLPAHVRPLTFAGEDVQGVYARTALLVTDYSSVAFNAAYVDAPVVYFQFDREVVLAGQHIGRAGYFDYERDGFGPVVTTAERAIDAIVAQLEHGPRPTASFQARIDRTFPRRDGHACERVVAAVEELSRPYPWPRDVQALLDVPGSRDA
jgi:glycosyltransferase involved in cell wall biosynthesis